jgi:hypothetical protein
MKSQLKRKETTPMNATCVEITKTNFIQAWDYFRNEEKTTEKNIDKSDLITLWIANETKNSPNLAKAWLEARGLISNIFITD